MTLDKSTLLAYGFQELYDNCFTLPIPEMGHGNNIFLLWFSNSGKFYLQAGEMDHIPLPHVDSFIRLRSLYIGLAGHDIEEVNLNDKVFKAK